MTSGGAWPTACGSPQMKLSVCVSDGQGDPGITSGLSTGYHAHDEVETRESPARLSEHF